MDDYHLMKQQAGITWYLDLEASVEEAEDVAIETRPQYQPWRAYWPPKCERMMQIWLQSEFPEVLSWRFDRHLPFDRPWRTWTRSACALKDRAEGMSCRPMRDTAEYMNSLPPQSVLTQVAKASSDVDDLIRKCKLHTADPSVFHFLIPLNLYKTEKPYLSRLPSGTELPRTNIRTESQVLKVFDVSGYEPHFTLERSGFQYAKSPIRMEHWNDSSVCSEYIPKVEAWLVKHLKCSDAFVYAYNFRGNDSVDSKRKSTKTPFLRAHCDATAASCFKRLNLYFPDRAHNLMKKRVRFINIWRPISTPIQDCPLAMCDFRTVAPADLVSADIIFPHYPDEAYEVLYNPDQRWFYKKGMDWDDVLLFKLGDNSLDEAPLCPHSAFMDPSVPKDTPSRVSIEVRSIVFG
ncbi:hypothetical protein L207DRAFT_582798 [Hyaloscypha variabilis F]|uniref:Uncharacterized protein n=1 Tax=Hyaloscypha variabilis (strain UAMH 11265 / GT02V1 / F) TaxID=1149755 RepID=A0A2J6RQ27_HYAVF|nr:hypothetical protein L207DRAFT_582798 [Hyaloscypha variabilis F]